MEIPEDQYDLLDKVVKEMNTPYSTADIFINTQVKEVIEKYQEWKETVNVYRASFRPF